MKLSYSRKGNCERSISSSSSSSLDAVDVFRAHFDAEEMELQGIVLCAVSESGENGIGNKGSIGLWYFFHNWWM